MPSTNELAWVEFLTCSNTQFSGCSCNSGWTIVPEQLKDLVEGGLISRRAVKGSPPRVDYELTELGQTALPILDLICEWGKEFVGTAVKKRAGGKSV